MFVAPTLHRHASVCQPVIHSPDMATVIPRSLLLLPAIAAAAVAQTVPNIKDAVSCPNTPDGSQPYRVSTNTAGDLRRVVINAPDAVCNDGTPPYIYVRAARPGAMEPDGPAANRWLIHFNGGSHCSDFEECATRWCGIGQWEGTLMTTRFEGPTRRLDGLLGRNPLNRVSERNVVQIKYCSSDQYQGRRSNAVLRSATDPARAFSLHFRGATIVDAVIAALEQGVEGLPRLTDATDVLLSGDSAGSAGAKTQLDRIAARLRGRNPNVRVRGQFEAGFGLDLNGKQGAPAGDPRDPLYASKTEQYNRVQRDLYNAQLDDSCLAAHPGSPYLCSDTGYLTLNHLTTPFFQISDIQDPLALNGFLDSGLTGTPASFAQASHDQHTALTNIRNTAVERSAISAAPGVVARNCEVHVTYGNDDGFLGRRIRSGPNAIAYSYHDLLWNWLHGISPGTLLAPRPADTPVNPPADSICGARAPNAPASGTVATGSSASYAFGSPVAPSSIVATFGENLTQSTVTATSSPWPTTLGGLQVSVTDARGTSRFAPLYYVSPTQLLYLIPAGTAPGSAQIAIGSQRSTVEVAETAPGIYSASQTGKGVAAATYIRVNARGERTEGYLFDPNTRQATAIAVAPGDQIYLLLYGTGMRNGPATATVGDVAVPVSGPVAQGQYEGLDQINLGPLPLRVGLGRREIVIRQGEAISNITNVTFRTQ